MGKAMIIAWPETTARGDEYWYLFLKKLGIVKNLNFRVGHAAILLIDEITGQLNYYDFGRYITPRGMGRARSADTDPRLKIETKAVVNNDLIINLEKICAELVSKSDYTHGKGQMYFSVVDNIDYSSAIKCANEYVQRGIMMYGALAIRNSNCSRFVWDVYKSGLKDELKFKEKLHPTIKPSPISNVYNTVNRGNIYRYNGTLNILKVRQIDSLRHFTSHILINFSSSGSSKLPKDSIAQQNDLYPPIPENKYHKIFFLEGLGESAWYSIFFETYSDTIIVAQYDLNHINVYKHFYYKNEILIDSFINNKLAITYNSNLMYTTFKIENQTVRLYPDDKELTVAMQFIKTK
jgi:hypothetical protein